MMQRRSTMRRTGFKRTTAAGAGSDYHAQREQRLAERAARTMASATPSPDNVTMAANDQMFAEPIEKENPLRSEAYRRAVASLPCTWCGIVGYSQHAHLNLGKGFALKTDDRTGFPLCCARPGIEGCHIAYDQYRLIEGGRDAHHAYGQEWGRITRHTILEQGLWPQRLPLWSENA